MEVEELEESKWKDTISCGFERLVTFASTEMDKRRRSTEGDSCNTSPDSGIGHGEPLPPTVNSAPSKQAIKLNTNVKPSLLKSSTKLINVENSPTADQNHESGLPRTPSPSSPPNVLKNFSPSLPHNLDKGLNPALLKYQRHTEEKKHKPDQHFKKKFYFREWREDSWKKRNDNVGMMKDKFKPKGKDWDWNRDHHSGGYGRGAENGNEEWNSMQQDHYGRWKN